MKFCRTPFFIWFTGRTGSTLLCDLLDSHPQIHCRKEVFSAIRHHVCAETSDPDNIVEHDHMQFVRQIVASTGLIHHPTPDFAVEHLQQLFSCSESACGFKLKYPSQSAVFPEIMEALHTIDGLKVISLSRRNVLKQAISLRNVDRIRQLGICQSGNTTHSVQLEPLQLDLESTIRDAKYFRRTRREFRGRIQSFSSVFHATYEQLQTGRDRLFKRLLKFLEVDDKVTLSSALIKITPDRIRDSVSNYEELVDAVSGTNLEQFLD